jgi:hypothetical protein
MKRRTAMGAAAAVALFAVPACSSGNGNRPLREGNVAQRAGASTSPAFITPRRVSFAAGTYANFQSAVSRSDAALTESGALPPGMHYAKGVNGTALIYGAPTVGGLYPITLTATSPAGISRQALDITVTQRPAFGAINDIWGVALVHLTRRISATGYPTPAFTLSDPLPKGLNLIDNGEGTATISGAPKLSASGISNPGDLAKLFYRSVDVGITATNSVGSVTKTLTIHVFLT